MFLQHAISDVMGDTSTPMILKNGIHEAHDQTQPFPHAASMEHELVPMNDQEDAPVLSERTRSTDGSFKAHPF